jgi:alpha-1,2-mannosyltransferase
MRMLGHRYVRLWLACVLGAGMLAFYFGLLWPEADAVRASMGGIKGRAHYSDLYILWRGTRAFVFEGQNPYAPAITRDIQAAVYGRPLQTQYGAFAYPAFATIVFAPLALLPFALAKLIFLLLMVPGVAASLWCWMRATGAKLCGSDTIAATVLLLTWYPSLEAFFLEQPALLVAVLAGAAMLLVARDRLGSAGVLFAISTIKPQATFLLVLVLGIWVAADWRGRRRLAMSFAGTLLLLCAIATMIAPRWWTEWLSSAAEYPKYASLSILQVVLGAVPGKVAGLLVVLGSVLLAVKTRHVAGNSLALARCAAMALLGALTMVPNGDAVYSHQLAFPAVVVAGACAQQGAFCKGLERKLFVVACTAFLWPWIAASGVCLLDVIRPGATHGWPLALPIRTSEFTPLAVLLLLAVAARDLGRMEAGSRPTARLPVSDGAKLSPEVSFSPFE